MRLRMSPLVRFVALPLGLAVLGALVVLPNVIHVLDRGQAAVSADAPELGSIVEAGHVSFSRVEHDGVVRVATDGFRPSPGDVVTVEIDGIGSLTNPIVSPDGAALPARAEAASQTGG